MEENKPVRLDVWLASKYPSLTRSQVKKLIESGHVTVQRTVTKKPSTFVTEKDKVALNQKILDQTIPDIELDVLYEDNDCVVIHKPLGVLTHSKGAFNPEGTVASWLAGRSGFSFNEPNDRSGIVHRLDRATSGVMICAKNVQALGHLQKQFQTRKAKKKYIARIAGHLKHDHARLDLPIERNPKRPQTFRVGINGKSAFTEYRVLEEFDKDTLIELMPTTGRTHQLRVHMQHLGHPIIGDTLYGGRKASRLYLHAAALEITLPTGGVRKTFETPLPEEFLGDKAV